MNIYVLLKGLPLVIIMLSIIGIYTAILKRTVDQSSYKLWFAAGIFLLITLLFVFYSQISSFFIAPFISNQAALVIDVLWWVSLYYLLNKAIDYWIWNRFYLSQGIVVSKIIRDFAAIILVIIITAAIMNFVFNRSVLGLFTASGVMAIILGYSAQATLSDIFAGLGLNTARAFSDGDWIKINDPANSIGKVVDINWRVVTLKTKENNYLTFPNSVISKLSIVNLSLPQKNRGIVLNFPFHVSMSPARMKDILLSSANQSLKVVDHPPPKAELISFKGIEAQYQLVYYTAELHESVVNNEILSIIWYRLQREGILIIGSDHSSRGESHGKKSEALESTDKALPKEKPKPAKTLDVGLPEEHVVAFLKESDLFHMLNKSDLNGLASKAIHHQYGPPERILKQGQSNTSLFMIYTGGVDVFFSARNAAPLLVTHLKTGDYFGEMSLLTGESCNASIIVNSESTVIEINHDNIAELFKKRPELMEKIGAAIIQRKDENTVLQHSMERKKNKGNDTLSTRLLNNIKSFFKHSV